MGKVVQLGGAGGLGSQRIVTVSLLDSQASLWARLAKQGATRLSMGFPTWEKFTRPAGHQYVILAARPGLFKTTVAWNWALNLATQGKRVLWLGAEMDRSTMALWTIARSTGMHYHRLEDLGRQQATDSLPPSEQSRLREATEMMESLPIVMWEGGRLSARTMIDLARQMPYDAVFLDYIQLAAAATPGGDRISRIDGVSQAIVDLVRALPLYFVALSQISRDTDRMENGRPKPPVLADLKGSGKLEADADVVAFLWRPPVGPSQPDSEVTLRIEKNRNGIASGVIDLQIQHGQKLVGELWRPPGGGEVGVRPVPPDARTGERFEEEEP